MIKQLRIVIHLHRIQRTWEEPLHTITSSSQLLMVSWCWRQLSMSWSSSHLSMRWMELLRCRPSMSIDTKNMIMAVFECNGNADSYFSHYFQGNLWSSLRSSGPLSYPSKFSIFTVDLLSTSFPLSFFRHLFSSSRSTMCRPRYNF